MCLSLIGLTEILYVHMPSFEVFMLQDVALVSTTKNLYVPTIVCINIVTFLCSIVHAILGTAQENGEGSSGR